MSRAVYLLSSSRLFAIVYLNFNYFSLVVSKHSVGLSKNYLTLNSFNTALSLELFSRARSLPLQPFNLIPLFYAPIIFSCFPRLSFEGKYIEFVHALTVVSRGNSMSSKCKLNKVSFLLSSFHCWQVWVVALLPFLSRFFMLIHSTILLWFCFTFLRLSLPSAVPF